MEDRETARQHAKHTASQLRFDADGHPVAPETDFADALVDRLDAARLHRRAPKASARWALRNAVSDESAAKPTDLSTMLMIASALTKVGRAAQADAQKATGQYVRMAKDYGELDVRVIAESSDNVTVEKEKLAVAAAKKATAERGEIHLLVGIVDRPDLPQTTYRFTLTFPVPRSWHDRGKGRGPEMDWVGRSVVVEKTLAKYWTDARERAIFQVAFRGLALAVANVLKNRKSA